MEYTYIVSGYMRSGTSMMMKALNAGGLEVEKNDIRELLNTTYGDENYKPNIGGFYELSDKQLNRINFPEQHKGKLIKVLFGNVTRISGNLNYKIVFMLRDKEEIRQSFEAFFGKPPMLINQYDELMDYNINILKDRKSVDLTILNYKDVINNPKQEFMKLKDSGWDIDVDKCVKIIDKSQYRFRKENLIEGA